MSCCSKKQPTISTFNAEAEYRNVANATVEIMCVRSLLSEHQVKTDNKAIIWCDNLTTDLLSTNTVLRSRTKHMKLDLYFVREQVTSNKLNINYTPASNQIADILTKPPTKKNILLFKEKLKVGTADNHHQVTNNLI